MASMVDQKFKGRLVHTIVYVVLRSRTLARFAMPFAVLLLSACSRQSQYVVPECPLPPDVILLSQVMRKLSSEPGFTDRVIARIDGQGKTGAAILTPDLAHQLRVEILGKDWQRLDRFPGWDVKTLTSSVAGIDYAASRQHHDLGHQPLLLDLGPYDLHRSEPVSLDKPSPLSGFPTSNAFNPIGNGVVHGAAGNDLASEHPESSRLAFLLNRLAANRMDGTPQVEVRIAGRPATSAEGLIKLLALAGYEVVVDDTRYFANFGQLRFENQDVMMPFWIDTHILIPQAAHSRSTPRSLLVPVSHAELELHVHALPAQVGTNASPLPVHADISYYFGVDGKSEWRTMDTRDQRWVLKREAHAYSGGQASEVVRLTSLITLAYLHQHQARPGLPFGGYYPLGVCQDGVALVEQAMTGTVTLFPLTADASLFTDSRDAEINALVRTTPKDRDGVSPSPQRIFGALPTTDFSQITIPGFAEDLKQVFAAWQSGKLRRL